MLTLLERPATAGHGAHTVVQENGSLLGLYSHTQPIQAYRAYQTNPQPVADASAALEWLRNNQGDDE